MTYLPVPAYTTQVDYTIANLGDLEDLVSLGVVTKTLVSGSTYKYSLPVSGSFGVKGLINLGQSFIEFAFDANQRSAIYGLDPGNSGFTTNYAGPVINIGGVNFYDVSTYLRVHLHGLLLINTHSSGYCVAAKGISNIYQRVLFEACTFKQGPVAQTRLVLLWGGGMEFSACDFCRSIGSGTLSAFIDLGPNFDSWGVANFNCCSFHGKIPGSDSITVTAAVSRTNSGGSPPTAYSFNGCYFSHVNALISSVSNIVGMSLIGCAVGKVNYISSAVSGVRDLSLYSTDIQQLGSAILSGSGASAGYWYPRRSFVYSSGKYLDGYGGGFLSTQSPGASVNNYWYSGFEMVRVLRLNPTANSEITGFQFNAVATLDKVLINVSDYTITLRYQNASSDPQNRIITNTGADIVMTKNNVVRLIYDRVSVRFRAII